MLTLDLWKKACPKEYFSFIGEKIGDGSDGEVFELVNDSDKVIKISILYDIFCGESKILEPKYLKLFNIFERLRLQKPTIYAQLYSHNLIGCFSRPYFIDNKSIQQDYILYSYTMEKCFKLTEDEKKIFHTIISHEDRGIVKKFSIKELDEILFGLSRGLDFDSKKIRLFYELLMASSIKHLDLHPRNIMKDKNGNFKLIDFDRLQLETT
jgi:serine/threonine protein kinase